uniref:Maturase n=2 Tax=Balanophora laxiflora TaxID=1128103 RepID=A0A3Q9JN70_9MAGN|nr:maturase [Balanophora laxiflora]UPI49006.1 maturase R [Balanophora laxiflora]
MKEAIRMVPEVIYESSSSSQSSILRQIKEEWGTFSWFLELDIRKCFHTIDRHRLIPIFKEEIDDAQFFYPILKIFYAVEKENDEKKAAHSVLLSALPGNIYLQHKLDQEIWRIRHKYEIPIVQRILMSRIDAHNYSEEDNTFPFNINNRYPKSTLTVTNQLHTYLEEKIEPADKEQPSLGFITNNTLLYYYSYYSKNTFIDLEAFLNKPSSLLFASFLIEKPELFFGIKRCNKSNWPMRDLFFKYYCIISGRPVIRSSERANNNHYLIRIYHARYADDSLLGIMGGTLDLIIEIHKRIAHFIIPQAVYAAGSTRASRSTVEFPGTVIRVPPSPHPLQFRELEKRKRLKHRIHITACQLRFHYSSNNKLFDRSKPKLKGNDTIILLEAVKLSDTTNKNKKAGVSVLWGTLNKHIHIRPQQQGWRSVPAASDVIQAVRKLSSLRDWGISSIKIEAPIKKILRRLQDRGLISRIKPRPLHVACLTNLSDGDIVNWSAGIAISPLSYYRCRDNLYQVRTIVDYQIRWSAIFTLAHKHKSSVRNIISLYSKDMNI